MQDQNPEQALREAHLYPNCLLPLRGNLASCWCLTTMAATPRSALNISSVCPLWPKFVGTHSSMPKFDRFLQRSSMNF